MPNLVADRETDTLLTALDRRLFLGAVSLLGLSACSTGPAVVESATTREVTTPLGTYQIPVRPARVVTIDSRLDLEPALALQLPVVATSYAAPEGWVPNTSAVKELAAPPKLEEVAAEQPDLILCTDVGADSEWWPIKDLVKIAPVLPIDYTQPWRRNLEQLTDWLGLVDTDVARAAVRQYDDRVAEVRTTYAQVIKDHSIGIVQYGPDGVMASTAEFITRQVAGDLGLQVPEIAGASADGGKTLQVISQEKYDVLSVTDGLLVTTSSAVAAARDTNSFWQRVPAVAQGHVSYSDGNINFGSVYTALEALRLIEELLAGF